MPSRTTSGTLPRANAITGVPQAHASAITMPNGSSQPMGMSSAAASPSSRFFCSSSTGPT